MVLLDDLSTGTENPMGRALALSARAATVGFDWPDVDSVLDKVVEELEELRACLATGGRGTAEELGDLLFAIINVARKLEVDPAVALERTNQKFVSRFGHVERRMLAGAKTWDGASLTELERLWNEAKVLEHTRPSSDDSNAEGPHDE